VNRILAAVRKSIHDEVQLASDIFEAYIATRCKLDLGDGAKAAERLQKVRDIQKAVEKHADLIVVREVLIFRPIEGRPLLSEPRGI